MQNNKMKLSLLSYSILCVCVLSACSSEVEKKRANRDFDYTTAVSHPQLKTPAPLQAPSFSQEYRLPVETRKGVLGEDVDVRPPEQIMPFITSSRADSGRNTLMLWFSARTLNQQIDEDVWAWLNGYLAANKIPVTRRDDVNKIIETGPVAVTFEGEKEDDIPPAPAQHFQFQVKSDQSTHRAGLMAKWLRNADDQQATPTIFEQRRYATRLLNNVSAYADTHSRNSYATSSGGPIQLVLGEDSSGSKAIVAQNSFVSTWQWLLAVLPKAGLPIDQSSQSQGLIVFNYDGDSSVSMLQVLTFWEPVEETDGLALSAGKYRLQLADRGNETSITLLDDNNKPVLVSAVEKLYQRLQQYTNVAPVMVANTAATGADKVAAQPKQSSEVVSQKPIHLVKTKEAWVADAPADQVLSRMSAELSQLGWAVKQTDTAAQRIDVEYTVPGGSLLDAFAIWKPLAPHYSGLDSGSYIFQLTQLEKGTRVELLTSAQQAVPAATAEQVYQALAKKLQATKK